MSTIQRRYHGSSSSRRMLRT